MPTFIHAIQPRKPRLNAPANPSAATVEELLAEIRRLKSSVTAIRQLAEEISRARAS